MAISGTALVVLTGASMVMAEKRADKVEEAQKRVGRIESAERADQARKSRREQVREARIRQAQVENVAATSGQTGSSAAVAAGDSLTAQLSKNIGNLQDTLAFGGAKSTAQQKILDANRKGGLELVSEFGIKATSSYLGATR